MVLDVVSPVRGKLWNSMVFDDLFLDQEKKRTFFETREARNSDFEQTKAIQQSKVTTPEFNTRFCKN